MVRSRRGSRSLWRVGVYAGLVASTLILLFPFLWMLSTSIKPDTEIFTLVPHWIPERPTLDNYRFILSGTTYPLYFRNSLVVSVATMVWCVAVASFGGYALSRFRFRGRTAISMTMLFVQMFPGVLLAIPMFILMRRLGLVNSLASLIITYGTFALPFSTWMLKGYFDTVPVELEEAAAIEGCGPAEALWRIVMPLAAPGLVAVALFAFVTAWQEYLFALTLTRTEEMRTLTVGLALMQGQHGRISWGQIMAGSALASLPTIAIFGFLQRFLVQGFTQGAVKG